MITHYTVLTPGEPVRYETCELAFRPSFAEIRSVVIPWVGDPGESLEHRSVLQDDERRDMFIAEWARRQLGERGPMAPNPTATKMLHAWLARQYPDRDRAEFPWVLGTAVLFHRRIWL